MMALFTNSTHNLIRSIETNQYALWLEAAQLTGHPWHHDPQITWVDCSPSPSPQGIFSARFGKDEAQERVAWVKSQVLAEMEAFLTALLEESLGTM
ncbi:MAG: hypothetical protein HPY85_11490 [Anaerolineae bacterium]|nr:hypothetical protein [Anaerolineae bacterium]